jgi:very-short-patch-repair endonuclease
MSQLPADVHRLFTAQHGAASLTQLRDFGLGLRQIEHLERSGAIIGTVRGAYRTPSAPVTELSRCAAWCLAHPHVSVAGVTAGRIWSFRKLPADRRIHLLGPRSSNPSTVSPGVVTYHTNAIRAADIIHRRDGIRVTSRARTAMDLGRTLSAPAHRSVIEQAAHEGNLTRADLLAVGLPFAPYRPWVVSFLDVVMDRIEGNAESHAEWRVGEALRSHGVTGLVRQFSLSRRGRTIRFDLAVPTLRWAVEVDVFPTHREPDGIAADAERDGFARAGGWMVDRISVHDYEQAFDRTIARLVARFRSIAAAATA